MRVVSDFLCAIMLPWRGFAAGACLRVHDLDHLWLIELSP